MDRIIVGVDGSQTANEAATTAARLATSLGCELVVVSAFSDTQDVKVGVPGDSIDLAAHDVALTVARQVIEVLTPSFAGLVATPRADFGKVADVLVSVAEEVSATLIVVGNKRVQGVGRVLGSIASGVVHRAPCDVYIAHTFGNH